MRLTSQVIKMFTKKNQPRKAAWRYFTEEQIKALPPTRDAAYEASSMYYYTGKLCPNNHIAARYRESRNCVVCHADKKKRKFYKNKSRSKKQLKEDIKKFRTITVMGINFNELLSDNKD